MSHVQGILHRVQAEGGHALEGWQETFLGGPPELDNGHTGNASGGGNSTFIQVCKNRNY